MTGPHLTPACEHRWRLIAEKQELSPNHTHGVYVRTRRFYCELCREVVEDRDDRLVYA